MRSALPAGLTFAAGLLAVYVSRRLAKACAPVEGNTTFYRFYSPVMIGRSLADILLFAGVLTCAIGTPMVWISNR